MRRPPAVDSTHRPTHLADLVEAAAARHADHPALIDAATGATLTWAELDATVSAEARRLAGAGVVAGDRVVIRCARGPALAVAVLGALRAGAVAVPVGPGDVSAGRRPLRPPGAGGRRAAAADVERRRSARSRPSAARRSPRWAAGRTSRCSSTPPKRGPCACRTGPCWPTGRRRRRCARPPSPPWTACSSPSRCSTPTGWPPACSRSAGPVRRPCCRDPGGPTPRSSPTRSPGTGSAGSPACRRPIARCSTSRAERLRTALAGLRLCTCGGVPLPRPWATAFQEATGHRIVEGYGLTEAGPVVTSTPIDGVAVAGLGGASPAGDRAAARGPRRPADDAAARGRRRAPAARPGGRGGVVRRRAGRSRRSAEPEANGSTAAEARASPSRPRPDPERPTSAGRRGRPAPVRSTSAPPRAASPRTSWRWRNGASRSSAPWPSAPPSRSAPRPSAPPPRSGPPCGPATRSAT